MIISRDWRILLSIWTKTGHSQKTPLGFTIPKAGQRRQFNQLVDYTQEAPSPFSTPLVAEESLTSSRNRSSRCG